LDKEQEKWTIFCCELLTPVIYNEIEADLSNRFLRLPAKRKICFPTGVSANHRFAPCAVNSMAIRYRAFLANYALRRIL